MEDSGDNSTANSLRMAALALASEDTASTHSIHSVHRIEVPTRPQSAPPPEPGRWADVEEQQCEDGPPQQRQQLDEQQAIGEDGIPASDRQMLLRIHSAASSIYTTDSASLVAPYTGSSSMGRTEGGAGGGSAGNHALSGGTLSPQYTLVNSDGASLRVHTGSIRERYLNNRISAIQEDDSDSVLLFSTRTVPSVILSPRTATIEPSTGRHQHQPYSYGHDGATFDENDAFSMVSGFSEGGASTTRMRMATDRAYNALRIGPNAAAAAAAAAAASLFSYYSQGSGGGANAANANGGPVYRPVSLATSNSDPGVTSAGSFSEYYYNAGENGSLETQSTDMLSIIRSDVAIYGGASEDIKFPFPPDNLSDFSADLFSPHSFEICNPGAAGTSSQQQYPYQQHQYQQRADSFEGNDGGNDRPATAAHRAVFGTKIRKKKMHSSRNGRYLYHHRHQPTTPVVAAAAAEAAGAAGAAAPSSGAMQPQPSPLIGPLHHHHHHHHHRQQQHREEQQAAVSAPSNPGAGAVRPNAIMRFLKRITPRN
ncbi:hypothetical protein GGI23_004030 [Coemansia sp. RSA 2559]|nr:hypothetical protein GGI23_004030 [Coemansia sp. RSA 2559]KAJ2861553.1 hypothetical protein GGI22_002429 [Coemansia erecta]